VNLQPSRTGLLRRPPELLSTGTHTRRSWLSRPLDRTWARACRDEALRFLLIGDGLAHGWGAAGHRAAPTGELARGIRAITGTDCEVESVGDEAMSAAAAVERLADRADGSFDGAVVAIGANDAMRLTPVADWGARLVNLLNAVQSGLPKGAPVILVGVPDVHVPNRIRSMNPLAIAHARRLDRVANRLAAVRDGVVYLPAPRLGRMAGRRPNGDLYAAFTLPIAAALTSAVRRTQATLGPFAGTDRFERPARANVEAVHTDHLAALRSLVERAAAEFHVQGAMVTLLDGDRTWRVANTGSVPLPAPHGVTYCETVVATDEQLVVEDAERDARFSENAYLRLGPAAFYAGVPIHAEDGTAIGAVCLLHDVARSEQSVDLDRLRDLAHQVELILRAASGRLHLVPER
jgi:hypothetical protein